MTKPRYNGVLRMDWRDLREANETDAVIERSRIC